MVVFRGAIAANGGRGPEGRRRPARQTLSTRRNEEGFGQNRKPIVQIPESVRERFSKGEMGGPEAFMDERALAQLSRDKKVKN